MSLKQLPLSGYSVQKVYSTLQELGAKAPGENVRRPRRAPSRMGLAMVREARF